MSNYKNVNKGNNTYTIDKNTGEILNGYVTPAIVEQTVLSETVKMVNATCNAYIKLLGSIFR